MCSLHSPRPSVPSRSLPFTLSPSSSRGRTPSKGLSSSQVFPSSARRENFPVVGSPPRRHDGRIESLSSCCNSGSGAFQSTDAPMHFEPGERRRKTERATIYQTRPHSAAFARSFTIPRADPTGIPRYRVASPLPPHALLFSFVCESPFSFFPLPSSTATNYYRDGKYSMRRRNQKIRLYHDCWNNPTFCRNYCVHYASLFSATLTQKVFSRNEIIILIFKKCVLCYCNLLYIIYFN